MAGKIRHIGAPAAILIDHSSHYQLEATILFDPSWDCAWFDPIAAVYVNSNDVNASRDPSGDLVRRHFGDAVDREADAAIAAEPLRDGINGHLMEASALLNIALAAGPRSTNAGIDRRVLLLLARRLSHQAERQLPVPAWRISSQVAFQMYATPTTPPDEWQLLELLGPARSRHLLHRGRSVNGDNLGLLLDEIAIATAVADPDAIYFLSGQIAAGHAQSPQEFRLKSLVEQNMQLAYARSMHDPSTVFDLAVDTNDQIRRLYKGRRFERIKAEFGGRPSDGTAIAEVTADVADLIARSCLICGDPQSARELWLRAEHGESSPSPSAGIGMTFLVEQEHARAIERFQEALIRDPGDVQSRLALVICHLELGQAAAAVKDCDKLMSLPETSEEAQKLSTRLREFAAQCADVDGSDPSETDRH